MAAKWQRLGRRGVVATAATVAGWMLALGWVLGEEWDHPLDT
jgi:hypothetical protein